MEEMLQTSNNPVEPVIEPVNQLPSDPPSTIGQMLGYVFSDPMKLGNAIMIKSHWWVPFLICGILSGISAFLTQDQVMALSEKAMRDSFSKQNVQMTEDQIETIVNASKTAMKVILPLQGFIGPMIMALVGGLIFMFVCNLLMGGKVKFAHIFAGLMWVSLLFTASTVIKTPLIIMQNSAMVAIGPAVLLPEGTTSGFMFVLLSGLDLFMVWQVLAFGVVLSAFYQWSKGKGMTVSVAIYMGFILIAAALSAMGSGGIKVG